MYTEKQMGTLAINFEPENRERRLLRQKTNLYSLPITIVREWETALHSLIAANNRYLLWISLV
jgi:hypothetical protein